MGTDKVQLKYDAIYSTNQGYGRNADGTMVTGPFMGGTELAMMGGMGVFTAGTQYKQLLTKPTWTFVDGSTQQISRWSYGKKMLKANFSSWSNFNNMEFIDTRVQQLEGIMKGATPEWPKKVNKYFSAYSDDGKTALKNVFNEIVGAKDKAALDRILAENVTINGQTHSKAKIFKHLVKHLPQETAIKLQNIVKYNEMYGSVLNDFKVAQNTMRNGGRLRKGQIDLLHRNYARARQAENQFIRATEGVLGVERKAGVSTKAKTGAKMSATTKKAMAASKYLRKFSRGIGKAGGPLMAAITAVTLGLDVYTAASSAKEGEGWRDGTRQLAKSGLRAGAELGGAWAGMKAGAAIGALAGPVGAAVGGLIGSFVGWAAGSWLANKSDFINKPVVEERADEQRQQQQQQVCNAVEKGDINTVAQYTAQFMEYEVDENGQPIADEEGNPIPKFVTDAQGQPILDENGNPQFKYIQVSEDPNEQMAFEQRIRNLNNWVMTEAAKQEEAAKLREQAELARQQRYAQAGYGTDYNYTNSYAPYSVSANQTGSDSSFGSVTGRSYSWQNPAWQNSLADQYDENNIFAFNQSNYTLPWTTQKQKETSYAPAA